MAIMTVRERFHLPDRYFLSHSVGCLPRTVEAGLSSDYLDAWRAGATWDVWMPLLDDFRAGIAELLGVTADTICPQVNVSSALTKIIHALPFDPARPEILLSRHDFPTIGFVVKQAERAGYRLKFIDGPPWDAQSWSDAIGEKTAIVHVTHALSNTSHRLPVGEICAEARARGAISIVDIAQSLIALPTPVQNWNADFVIGTGVKFLCAGPGACFLYVSTDRLPDCAPVDVGWFSHENPFEMDIERFRYAEDAMRFFGGTPSPAPLACANAVFETWRAIGPEQARAALQRSIDRLLAQVPDDWLVSPRDRDRRGGTVVLSPQDIDLVSNRMTEADIQFDRRAKGLRLSVHAYTSDEDIDAVIAAIEP